MVVYTDSSAVRLPFTSSNRGVSPSVFHHHAEGTSHIRVHIYKPEYMSEPRKSPLRTAVPEYSHAVRVDLEAGPGWATTHAYWYCAAR